MARIASAMFAGDIPPERRFRWVLADVCAGLESGEWRVPPYWPECGAASRKEVAPRYLANGGNALPFSRCKALITETFFAISVTSCGGSSPCNWAAASPSAFASVVTAAACQFTKTPTPETNGGSLRLILLSQNGPMQRGLLL